MPLPGHTLGHTGFLTADGVLFTGDALYLEELWERHPPALRDRPRHGRRVARAHPRARLRLARARPRRARRPRGEPSTTSTSTSRRSREIEALILELLVERAHHRGDHRARLGGARPSDNPAQYWLAVTTVKGFLGDLLGRGEIEFFVRDHSGWWRAVS